MKTFFFNFLLILTILFSCQNNNSSDNDEKNDNQTDTAVVDNNNDKEVVENNSDNEEISEQRTDEEQIQFVKDEFARIEGNENLNTKNYSYEDEEKSLNVNQYYKNNDLVFAKFEEIFYIGDGSITTWYFYFYDEDLIFAYQVILGGPASIDYKTENRYYFKETEIIQHLMKKSIEKVYYDDPEVKKEEGKIIESEKNISVDSKTTSRILELSNKCYNANSNQDIVEILDFLYY